MPEPQIEVEVAWAKPDEQMILALRVLSGSAVAGAVQQIANQIPADLSAQDAGVFGQREAPDHVLHPGDRVELYRSLVAWLKDIRRELACLAK